MRQHKLWSQSSPDRGLEHLLDMWPKIREAYPDATLDHCYGWTVFDSAYANNPERQMWKEKIVKLLAQPGITDHGKIGQEEMRELRKEMGIFAYPTHFTEIFCIGVVESQLDGVVPVVMNVAALDETVGSGVKVPGDIYDPETQELYLKELLDMMGDKKRWMDESIRAMSFARQYAWPIIGNKWNEIFKA